MVRKRASKSEVRAAMDASSRRKEHYEARRRRKQKEDALRKRRERLTRVTRKAPRYVLYAGTAIVLAAGTAWWMWSRPSLPPITMAGHTETLPPGYILSTPMPQTIQKHMLEHAGGSGAPGVIIQYNCEDFECEPGLVEQLAEIARSYRGSVYLAPNTYDGKVILTKLDKRTILDQFDERAIRSFITR